MTHKQIFFTIAAMVLFVILSSGCSSTPTPETSVVWSDDFDDGNTDGWEDGDWPGDEYSVTEGVLSFGPIGGDIQHTSTVTTGTWSVDVFIPEKGGTMNLIGFLSSIVDPEADEYDGVWVTIENQPYTLLALHHWIGKSDAILESATIAERERFTGWHHIDITRDDTGNVKAYFDGELVLEHFIDFPYNSEDFYIYHCCEGPAIDNVMVRNQVISIQPPE